MASDYERLKRDRNYFKLELKLLVKKMAKIEAENSYLKKRDEVLTAIEEALPQRIAKYKENNAPAPVIMELEYISNILAEEKNRQKEEQEDE
jgi:hypothetical protein